MKCRCDGSCNALAPIVALLMKDKEKQAYTQAANFLMENRYCFKAQAAMAQVFMARKQFHFASIHYLRAWDLAEQPDNIALATDVGNCVMRAGNLNNARSFFTFALAINPDYAPALQGMKTLAEYRDAKGARQVNGHAMLNEGHALARAGDYDGAWQKWKQAKEELKTKGFVYDPKKTVALFNRFRQFYTTEMIRSLPTVKSDMLPRPIFICGYPRSGTTLIEQCLTQHPGVTGGDELPFIAEVINSCHRFLHSTVPYPFCLSELLIADTEIAIENMRDHYMSRMRERLGHVGTMYFTDKMPLNEMHIPFIRMMFPNALIIRCTRNEYDVALSNFSLFLTHGSHQACDIQSSLHHQRAVNALVEHWKKKMPERLGRYYECPYEQFVSDPEKWMRWFSGTLGIDYIPEMITPETNPRYARTASYSQVREPISGAKIGYWKHWKGHFLEAEKALENMPK